MAMNDKEKLYMSFVLADIIENLHCELTYSGTLNTKIRKLPKQLEKAYLNFKFGSREMLNFIKNNHIEMAEDLGDTSDHVRKILEEFVCAQR